MNMAWNETIVMAEQALRFAAEFNTSRHLRLTVRDRLSAAQGNRDLSRARASGRLGDFRDEFLLRLTSVSIKLLLQA
jgi:hypothetical protein